jgi:hypothetical protein
MIWRRTLLIGLLLAGGAGTARAAESREQLVAAVKAREVAAKTGRLRYAASGPSWPRTPCYGSAAAARRQAVWPVGPSSGTGTLLWTPERVSHASGTLAISSGPVLDPQGQRVGTFNSTWRREKDGEWRVVIDIGCPPCQCP